MTAEEYRALVASQQGEHSLQLEITRWLISNLGPNVAWSAIDHAAKLSERQAGERKRRGVRRGLGDYVFILAGGLHAEIELKRPVKSSKLSADQIEWKRRLEAAGAVHVVCRSLPEVIGTLKAWGVVDQAVKVAA